MPPLYAAALVVLFESLCFTTAFPVISYYTLDLGGSAAWVGVMFALMAGPKIVTNPMWGWLSDRIGRRPVLAINTLGTLAGSVTWALAPFLPRPISGLGYLALSRGFIGVFAGQAGLAQAIAADTAAPEKRSAALGVLGAAFGLAFAVGPLLGGWLAKSYSNGAVGWLCAGLQVASLAVILGLLPETRRTRGEQPIHEREDADETESSGVLSYARVAEPPGTGPIASRRVLTLLAVALLMTLAISELNSVLPLVTQLHYGFNQYQTGLAFALFGFLAALVQGGVIRPAIRTFGERTTAQVGFVLTMLGFGVLAPPPPVWGLWIAAGLLAIGTALCSPTLMGLTSSAVSPSRQGSLMGIYQGVLGFGRAGGAALGAWLFNRVHGPWGAFVSAIVVTLGALVLLTAASRKSARGLRGGRDPSV